MDYALSKPVEYKKKFLYAYRNNVAWGLHIHRSVEIVVVIDGVLRMQIGEQICDIGKGSAAFADSYEPHSFIAGKENAALIIEFSPEQFAPFSEWLRTRRPASLVIDIDETVTELLQKLLPDDGEGRADFSEARIAAALAPLCYSIMERGEWITTTDRYDDTFIKALTYISENFDKPISRESVARELGVRPETVSRIFLRESDISFVDYLHRIRVYEALRLLERGASATEAALSSGFDSIRTFNRVFKAIVGVTPTDYLKQY